MSRTDKTRPHDVQMGDPHTTKIRRHGLTIPVVSGLRGEKRHGKPHRKFSTRQRRQRDRRVTWLARVMPEVDCPPIEADRRNLI